MAIFKKCDGGCGKVSPNKKGLHVANKWYGVNVSRVGKHGYEEETFLLCEQCFSPSKPSSEMPWIKKIVAAFFRFN